MVEFVIQRAEYLEFDRSLRAERGGQVDEWEQMLREWEVDPRKPNPYLSKKKG